MDIKDIKIYWVNIIIILIIIIIAIIFTPLFTKLCKLYLYNFRRHDKNKEIKHIKDEIAILEAKKKEYLKPIIENNAIYVHPILYKKIPVNGYILSPTIYDSALDYKIKSAIYDIVGNEFFNACNYNSFNEFTEYIATKCLKITANFIKTQYYYNKYNFNEIKYMVKNYYNLYVDEVIEYLIDEVMEELHKYFPKASKIELWCSIMEYGNNLHIYNFKEKIYNEYIKREFNIDIDSNIHNLEEKINEVLYD